MDADHHELAGWLARQAGQLLAFAEGARDPDFKQTVAATCEAVWVAIASGVEGSLEELAQPVSDLCTRAGSEPRWATARTVYIAHKPVPAGLRRSHLRPVTGANL
jgi:hypothetical protein